ncbi:MAG TPA: hypothetical protein VFY06_01230, partial [Verrucomicrobiae bacterium]|nr:hypothetical protein [Verrucomicrobiae bacterium]
MKNMKTRSFLACLCSLVSLLLSSAGAGAATLVVTNVADSGPGSLRAAVTTANAKPGADVITFGPALSGELILLGSELVLSNQVTI